MKLTELNEDCATRKQELKNDELLKRKQFDADFEKKKNELEVKKMEQEKQLELQRYNNNFLIQEARIDKEQSLKKMVQDFDK